MTERTNNGAAICPAADVSLSQVHNGAHWANTLATVMCCQNALLKPQELQDLQVLSQDMNTGEFPGHIATRNLYKQKGGQSMYLSN